MSIIDCIIGLIAPHYCLGCQREGRLLCIHCQNQLQPAPLICFRCLRPTVGYQTCSDCFGQTGIPVVWRVTAYDGIAKELLWRLKFTGAQQAARDIAQCFASLHRPPIGTIVVPLPTATSRARQRGFDQAVLLAKAYARAVHTDYLPCLARQGQQHQRGANRQARLLQLSQAYRLKHGTEITGSNVILIDDVATTGASLQAAAQTLLAAGAKSVTAMVFAQA